MKNFIVYNEHGKILRSGTCQDNTFYRQAYDGEFVMEGKANDVTQKIVNGKVVDKTPDEIEKDSPPKPRLLKEKQPAYITNEQWQDVLKRLKVLEQG